MMRTLHVSTKLVLPEKIVQLAIVFVHSQKNQFYLLSNFVVLSSIFDEKLQPHVRERNQITVYTVYTYCVSAPRERLRKRFV